MTPTHPTNAGPVPRDSSEILRFAPFNQDPPALTRDFSGPPKVYTIGGVKKGTFWRPVYFRQRVACRWSEGVRGTWQSVPGPFSVRPNRFSPSPARKRSGLAAIARAPQGGRVPAGFGEGRQPKSGSKMVEKSNFFPIFSGQKKLNWTNFRPRGTQFWPVLRYF